MPLSRRIKKTMAVFSIILVVAVIFFELAPATSTTPINGWSASTWFHIYSPSGKSQQDTAITSLTPAGLTPSQIKKAYNLPATGGSGTPSIKLELSKAGSSGPWTTLAENLTSRNNFIWTVPNQQTNTSSSDRR